MRTPTGNQRSGHSFGKLPFPIASELEAVRMAAQFEHLVFDRKARLSGKRSIPSTERTT
jgi:hypothetical protein